MADRALPTAEELRAILQRHEHDRARPDVTRPSQMHDDRGALLDLLRAVAKPDPIVDGDCHYCDVRIIYDRPHAPDCPAALLLEVLRQS